ncbi:MAG: hypothetical protein WCA35_02005 [Kovacikia sp.]
MHNSQTFSSTFTCTVSSLTIANQAGLPQSHLQVGEPIKLQTTITFSDSANSELAKLLMATGLNVRVSFHAKPHQPGREVDLGSTLFSTSEGVLVYPIELEIKEVLAFNLSMSESYQISAIVRVGNSPFCVPSLMRGLIEGPKLQSARSEIAPSKIQELGCESEPQAVSKASRRKSSQMEKSTKKQPL